MLVTPYEDKLTLHLSFDDDFEDVTTWGLEDFGLYLFTSAHDGHSYIYDKNRGLLFFFTDCDNNMVDDLNMDLQLFEGLTLIGEPDGLSDIYPIDSVETAWEAIIASWAAQPEEETPSGEHSSTPIHHKNSMFRTQNVGHKNHIN